MVWVLAGGAWLENGNGQWSLLTVTVFGTSSSNSNTADWYSKQYKIRLQQMHAARMHHTAIATVRATAIAMVEVRVRVRLGVRSNSNSNSSSTSNSNSNSTSNSNSNRSSTSNSNSNRTSNSNRSRNNYSNRIKNCNSNYCKSIRMVVVISSCNCKPNRERDSKKKKLQQ